MYREPSEGRDGEITFEYDIDKNSDLAKNLKGRLLLVHGMEDSNVLYQDTVRVYRELLKADKETLVELFLDQTGGHGLGGDLETGSAELAHDAEAVSRPSLGRPRLGAAGRSPRPSRPRLRAAPRRPRRASRSPR